MILHKTLCLLLVTYCSQFFCFSQSPFYDRNWHKIDALSDEFKYDSGSSDGYYIHGLSANISTSKWDIMNQCNPSYTQYGYDYGGSSAFDPDYTFVYPTTGNGYLCLKVDTSLSPYCRWSCRNSSCPDGSLTYCSYNTGGIQSSVGNSIYSYGYYEMYAKLPGYIDGGGIAHADKFWPAFWMATQPICTNYWNELDIMDECCCIYSDAKTTGSFWGAVGAGADSCTRNQGGEYTVSPTPLCSAFHKYAAEWDVYTITFYRDDVPYLQTTTSAITMKPMYLLIDLQLSCSCFFDHNEPFPDTMKVDYFRYYQFSDSCSSSKTFANSSQILNYYYNIQSSFTFGNGSSSITVDSTNCGYNNYTFRAVNQFTIPNYSSTKFTVPLGTRFALIPTPCQP